MDLFWRQGYAGTSLDDLTSQMDINRSSFYAAFKSKNQLFLDSIDLYTKLVLGDLRRELASGESPRYVLSRMIRKVLDATGAADGGDRRGCFLGNTALEVAPHDEAAANRTQSGLARLEAVFAEVLKDGVRLGQLTLRRPAVDLARFLVVAVQGGLVLSKAGGEPDAVEATVGIAMDALE